MSGIYCSMVFSVLPRFFAWMIIWRFSFDMGRISKK